eukprot:gene3616-4647_t
MDGEGSLSLSSPAGFGGPAEVFLDKESPVCFGRDAELERLMALLLPDIEEQNANQSVALSVFIGQNGIGKTTVMDAFSHIVAARETKVLVFHATSSTSTTELPLSGWKPILLQIVQNLEDRRHAHDGSK